MAADNRTIKELSALGLDNAVPLCIQYPVATQGKTNEFELKSSLLHHMPKYHGLFMEDPNKHLKEFEVVAEGCKVQGTAPSICGVCSMQGHLNDQCPQLIENRGWENANAISYQGQNHQRNDPYSNTYNPGWRDHPNFKWREPQQPQQQGDFDSHPLGYIKGHLFNLNLNNKHLNQIQVREQGKLPSSTIVNPKGGFESAKAITLRSGKEFGNHKKLVKQSLNKDEKLLQEEEQGAQATAREDQSLPQPLLASKLSQPIKVSPNTNSSSSIPLNVPFPSRFRQSKKEENEKDILETFRKVQVNIPFLDAIKQVPKYAKFLKELCTTRKRISNKEVVQVNNLIFPADFYVLGMENSAHSTPLPILLERSFMKTARTKIDVFKGTLMMEFDGETIDFNISEAIKFPKDDHSCFSIDIFDSLAHDYLDSLDKDPLETTIAQGIGLKSEGTEAKTHSRHE
ncbi:unnamed protein product [Malus baccata var. baccata]